MSAIPLSTLATGQWQSDFVNLMPTIKTHARIRFRRLSVDAREEAIAETIAAACVNYQKLAAQGRLQVAYLASLANHAVRHAAQNRHVGGSQSSKDAMSRLTHTRQGVSVTSLDQHERTHWEPTVLESRHFPPPDVAAFRIDFDHWIKQQNRRDRRIIRLLMSGERTNAVADRMNLSSARVSQLRRHYEQTWRSFTADAIRVN